MIAEDIVKKLASFDQRACTGKNQATVLDFLESLFSEQKVVRQTFKSPPNYLYSVAWLILGISFGLRVSLNYPLLGFIITSFFAASSLLFFNWYSSPVSRFPPLKNSTNLIITNPVRSKGLDKVILMAHWDTAPISILYSPKMVGSFRGSLLINMILIVLALALTLIRIFWIDNLIVFYSIIALGVYFLIQMAVASIDFFRYGYSNGASDNATGVAAAITVAQELWKNRNIETELVITGAEEVGMLGAKAYYDAFKGTFNTKTSLINFDTLGAGDLKIITKTGSLNDIVYNNSLIENLTKTVESVPQLSHIKTGAWHTADFDSVWFQRAGINAVTLAALDHNGRMPNIHRETDVFENVDFKPMHDAIHLIISAYKNLK